MKYTIYIILVFTFKTYSVYSQNKYDYIWGLGYGIKYTDPNGITIGGMLFDFNSSPPVLSHHDFILKDPLSTISDAAGNLVAYTDGCDIANRVHAMMLNGDSLSPGYVYNNFCNAAPYPHPQGALFLPRPGSDSQYYLAHFQADDWTWESRYLLSTLIDAGGDNGLGEVLEKNKVVLEDFDLSEYLCAVRHANGRDWWIVAPRRRSNVYQRCLLTPEGLQYVGSQTLGTADDRFWSGQTAFSPDGSLYFKILLDGLRVMDFDRCTGQLSNFRFIPHVEEAGGCGVAVSPNGRFLYTTDGSRLYQFDLHAADLAASRQLVAEYDGYLSPFPTAFYQAALAPDGKIYLSTGSTNDVLHIIHRPDLPGTDCQVEQHGLQLPALTGWYVPNMANYRLGPLDCSACDSLQLDNRPSAAWTYETDTLSPLTAGFYDLSTCALSWKWDFGDGSAGSAERYPVHEFPAPGAYRVCLTVMNAVGEDTRCDTVWLRTSAANDPFLQQRISVWPNPFQQTLHVSLSARPASPVFRLFNYLGIQVLEGRLPYGVASFHTETFPPGAYFWEVTIAGERVKSGKLIRTD